MRMWKLARAGKYGKGFAVVAEEVRHLATKSSIAVKDTAARIEDAVRNIELGKPFRSGIEGRFQSDCRRCVSDR